MTPFSTIGIAGAGAWGTALANAAALAGRRVILWGRDATAMAQMQAIRENTKALPGIRMCDAIEATSNSEHLAEVDALLLVVPAQAARGSAEKLCPLVKAEVPLVLCAKGIERETGLFLTQSLEAVCAGREIGVLSGPSFAQDVARGLPTAVILAASDEGQAQALAAALSSPTFRVYHGTDRRGVEIGGALKNVLAIACGVVEGRGLGESARAALAARGFAEMGRFARAYGARPETLMGLSGLGDVMLTCAPGQSRNFAFGVKLGQGGVVAEASGGKLVEGALTAPALISLAQAKAIEMPIAETTAALIAGDVQVDEAITRLMSRPLKAER